MSQLPIESQLYLFTAALLLFGSCSAFIKDKEQIMLLFLFAGALFLRLFSISLDPYLNNWDERFHAIVAKNMIDNPFKPVLRNDPAIPYDYTDWRNNYIWLHKQPVFLWQMALSMKLFGVNEFALRLPSAVMGAIQVILIYRIGKLLLNRETGFIAAILFSCSYYQLQQTSGIMGMDHNDVAFGFYVTASIWSLFEYRRSGNKYWLVLIGIFSGMAILNKWLTGLLVYAGWGLMLLADKENRYKLKSYAHIITSLLITCLVFLPWQLYIMNQFPQESHYEFNYNSLHITESVEGHTGSKLYYLNQFTEAHYGYWAILPLLIGLTVIIYKSRKKPELWLFLTPIFAIYLFFSLFVVTKVPGYVFVVSSLIFITIGAGINAVLKWHLVKKGGALIVVLVICLLAYLNFSLPEILYSRFGSTNLADRNSKIENTKSYKYLKELITDEYVVFNVPFFEYTEAMFYSDRNVYPWFPTETEYNYLKMNNRKIAVFSERPGNTMPDYIKNDPEIQVIDIILK